ncbi:MAG: hypothetical protein WD042_05150 [Phycisphaeraceae bacterium]
MIIIGPWPAPNGSYVGSGYQAATLHRLTTVPPATATGPLEAGFAQLDITPPVGHQLAGFNRRGFHYQAVDTPCLARALTLRCAELAGSTADAAINNELTVTILSADLLMINRKLAQAVLSRTGLRDGDIYFTASHTHSGPGQWGDHPLETLIAGDYDQAYFDILVSQLAQVVTQSRQALAPAEVGVVTMSEPGGLINRIDRALGTHDQLSAVVVRHADAPARPPIAVLVTFGAHATVVDGDPATLSADYPGALEAALGAALHSPVMFAAGAVGDVSPARLPAGSPIDSARKLGDMLADDLAALIPQATLQRSITLSNQHLAVDLPAMRFPIGAHWRLSPLATFWIGDTRTHLHLLRIGPAVLVGFPGDVAGHLATTLADRVRDSGLTLIATSFNGDYKGYFVSQEVFMRYSAYETREVNFFGPWSGEYLNDLAARMISRTAIATQPVR